jgi:hypothetical protein
MKYKKKVRRLEVRIKDYEEMIAKSSASAKQYTKPGSFKR